MTPVSALLKQISSLTFVEVRLSSPYPIRIHSALAARLAAGFSAHLTTEILSGRARNGFALVRPPGHHAGVRNAMGFCLHNNAAVAVAAAQAAGAKKVLILDWYVHLGNGTQEIFEHDKSVRSTSFVHPLLSSCFEFLFTEVALLHIVSTSICCSILLSWDALSLTSKKLGYKPSTVDSNDNLIRPFVSMYFGAAYITWRSTPPMFSPSLDKRFWSTLRSRVDSLIEDRNKSESVQVDVRVETEMNKLLKEDSTLLLRGFDSVAQTLSLLSNNIDNALQGAWDLLNHLR
ncbi:hypothetical protein ACFE04_001218 [Oxalis oulophora]